MDSFPITIYRGDNVTLQFTITQSDRTAFDLTGSTVVCMAKKYLADTDANAKFTGSCILASDPATGVCTVAFQITTAETIFIELEYRKGTEIRTLKQWEAIVKDDVRKGT